MSSYVTFTPTIEPYSNIILLITSISLLILFIISLFLSHEQITIRKVLIILSFLVSFGVMFYMTLSLEAPKFEVDKNSYENNINSAIEPVDRAFNNFQLQMKNNMNLITLTSTSLNNLLNNFKQYSYIGDLVQQITKVQSQVTNMQNNTSIYGSAIYSLNNPLAINNYNDFINGNVPLSTYNLQQQLQLFNLNSNILNNQTNELNSLISLFNTVLPIQFSNIPSSFFTSSAINQTQSYFQIPNSSMGSYLSLDSNVQIIPLLNLTSQLNSPIIIAHDMIQADFLLINNLMITNNQFSNTFSNSLFTKNINGVTLNYTFPVTPSVDSTMHFNILQVNNKHYLICFQSVLDTGPLFMILPSGHMVFFITNNNNQSYTIEYLNALTTTTSNNGAISQNTTPFSNTTSPINLNNYNNQKIVMIIYDPYNNNYHLYTLRSAGTRSASIGKNFSCSINNLNVQSTVSEAYERVAVITPSSLALYINSVSINHIMQFQISNKILSITTQINNDILKIQYNGTSFLLETPKNTIKYQYSHYSPV